MSIIDKLEKGLSVQENCSSMMQFLVQDLLDYSQIKEGKFRKNTGLFDIYKAIEEVMSIQREKAQDKGIELSAKFVNFSASSPTHMKDLHSPLVYTDAQRLKQVVLNLQSNALKFTTSGRVTIIVEIIADERGQKFLQIAVEDTGVGISEED